MKRIALVFNFIASLLPYVFVFAASLFNPTDPDLGWHLKYGEYFFKHHEILRDNIFSVMMPDFKWANTSWLTDLLSYSVFHYAGFLGITILGALVVTLSFYFFSKAANLSLWSQTFIFPALLYFLWAINSVSFRGQLLTFLFLGILFYLINLYPKHPKMIFLTPPLFLLWSNFHGEFLFGMVFFLAWIFFYIFQGVFLVVRGDTIPSYYHKKMTIKKRLRQFFSYNKKEIFKLSFVYLLSFFASLVNPFGIDVYLTAISHIGSPLLQDVVEYLPIDMFSPLWWNHIIILTVIAIIFLVLYFGGKLIPPLFFFVLLFLFYSFEVRRYSWPVYYLILPILQIIPSIFDPQGKTGKVISSILLIIMITITVNLKMPLSKYQGNWDSYCRLAGCSPKATEFLINNKMTENLYSLYGWGGWMIWNYPEVKPLIDGRMHMWRDEKGYSGFEDYYGYEQDRKNIDESSYDIVYMSPRYPIARRLNELSSKGKWKMVFNDGAAVIYVRNKK